MPRKDARVDAYIATRPTFAQPILEHLRSLVHQACPDVEETIKWSHVHFQHRGMMCSMAAFTRHASFGFWRPQIRDKIDRAKDGMGQLGKIASLADLPPDKVLLGWIQAAAQLNEDPAKPARVRTPKPPLPVPPELKKALAADAKARSGFAALTAGCQREYIEWIISAKTAPTREKRLATTVTWVAQGKDLNWKYR